MPRKLDLPVLHPRAWPAADRAAWHAAFREGDVFDDGGVLARVDPRRIRRLEAAYGRWLGFLATTEPDGAPASGLPLFTRERVGAFYGRLRDALAPYTVRHYMTDLWTVARALGPDRSLDALAAATRHIWATAGPAADPLARLVPARDLYALGLDLMRTAAGRPTQLQEIGAYRDGLMIALLAACPLRLGNLAAIELDRHLTKPADAYRLAFAACEVKNRRALDYPLPASLTPWMDRYLEEHRPILLGRRGRWWRGDPGAALWVSRDGTRLQPGRIRECIERRTQERFGVPINPHRVRHIAVTSTAAEIPEHIGIAHAVLGHTGPRTAERFYNQANSLRAARGYQAVIDALRADREGAP